MILFIKFSLSKKIPTPGIKEKEKNSSNKNNCEIIYS